VITISGATVCIALIVGGVSAAVFAGGVIRIVTGSMTRAALLGADSGVVLALDISIVVDAVVMTCCIFYC
jgi:hypothetical protein